MKEERFLLPGVDRRPADVYIPSWAGGQNAALDVTVINPLQQRICFVPLAFESLGGPHKATVAEAQKLGAALARHTGQEEGEACHQLYCRLSILLQKGNAAILANRIPSHPDRRTDGDLDI
jgi:hypothetical protein